MIKHLPAELLQEMLTVEPCVAVGLVQLTMNLDLRYDLCIQKLLSKTELHSRRVLEYEPPLQPLQRCYCDNSESLASACVMRHHYSITYMQSLHAINDLIAVGQVGNLLCGRISYIK